LEMNTRLQVEHGVTELITGVDMVELQIKVAAGEPLTMSQGDIQARGHAIEARIYPEDPETFQPDAGVVNDLHLPKGEHIRIDSALFQGYQVASEYEPLLAKVMAWGEDREEAVKRLLRALRAFHLEGVKCNISLMWDILSSKEFASATYHTGSIPLWAEERRQAQRVVNGAWSANNHEKSDREIAAAVGVAMAVAMKGAQSPGPTTPASSPWRVHGRREQLLARTLGTRGWR